MEDGCRWLCISRDLVLYDDNPYVTFMHKSFDGYDLYMLMNTNNAPFETNISIPCNDGDSLCFINPDNLETQDISADIKEKSARIFVKFDALSPVIICKY